MKPLLITTLLAAAALAAPAVAQQKADDHAAHHPTGADLADGEVRKVDKETAKVTIKHGEIKSLDMPAMTMVFQVKDVTLLDKVRVGDKVRFRAEKITGGYAVTAIESAR
jgi:Cu/Ag efflux protein CusF